MFKYCITKFKVKNNNVIMLEFCMHAFVHMCFKSKELTFGF